MSNRKYKLYLSNIEFLKRKQKLEDSNNFGAEFKGQRNM